MPSGVQWWNIIQTWMSQLDPHSLMMQHQHGKQPDLKASLQRRSGPTRPGWEEGEEGESDPCWLSQQNSRVKVCFLFSSPWALHQEPSRAPPPCPPAGSRLASSRGDVERHGGSVRGGQTQGQITRPSPNIHGRRGDGGRRWGTVGDGGRRLPPSLGLLCFRTAATSRSCCWDDLSKEPREKRLATHPAGFQRNTLISDFYTCHIRLINYRWLHFNYN